MTGLRGRSAGLLGCAAFGSTLLWALLLARPALSVEGDVARLGTDPARDAPSDSGHPSSRAIRGPIPLEIVGGVQGFSRSFSYVQDVNANLRPYSLALAPAGFLSLEWYPGAHFTRGPVADVGLVVDYARSVATSSSLEPGQAGYATTLQSFSAGLRGRLPLGPHELGLSLRAGRQDFSIAGATDTGATLASGARVSRAYVPNVEYAYVRPGVDVRLRLGDFGIGVRGGYRIVIDAGEIQSATWFPRSTVAAGDLGVFLSYALSGGFEARVGGELHRYAYDMHSSPSDLRTNDVAGGAVDQYAAGYVALAWRAPGR